MGKREWNFFQSSGPTYIQEGPELYRKDRHKGYARHAAHNRRNNQGPNGGCTLWTVPRLLGLCVLHSVISG